MPGRAAHQEAAAAAGGPEPTAAGGSAGAAAQQERRGLAGAFPLVLKKLMENPPREARLGERGGALGGGGSARRPPLIPLRRPAARRPGPAAGEAARPGPVTLPRPSLPPPPGRPSQEPAARGRSLRSV